MPLLSLMHVTFQFKFVTFLSYLLPIYKPFILGFNFKNLEIMGGEGSMMAANNSLKNNRSLVSKRKERHALTGSYSNVTLKEFPDATPQKLKNIREKIQFENRIIRKKQFIAFCVLIFLSILLIYNL